MNEPQWWAPCSVQSRHNDCICRPATENTSSMALCTNPQFSGRRETQYRSIVLPCGEPADLFSSKCCYTTSHVTTAFQTRTQRWRTKRWHRHFSKSGPMKPLRKCWFSQWEAKWAHGEITKQTVSGWMKLENRKQYSAINNTVRN